MASLGCTRTLGMDLAWPQRHSEPQSHARTARSSLPLRVLPSGRRRRGGAGSEDGSEKERGQGRWVQARGVSGGGLRGGKARAPAVHRKSSWTPLIAGGASYSAGVPGWQPSRLARTHSQCTPLLSHQAPEVLAKDSPARSFQGPCSATSAHPLCARTHALSGTPRGSTVVGASAGFVAAEDNSADGCEEEPRETNGHALADVGNGKAPGPAVGAGAVPVPRGTPAVASPAAVALWLDAFWRFCRPHTVIGTTLSILSVSLLALPPLSAGYSIHAAAIGILQALIPALCMNVYIVGLNQIFDIEIDKVNKPYLPLASGEFSVSTGVAIVSAAAGISVALGMLFNSPPLLATLLVSMLLGTAYSIDLPGLRWKRYPVLAAACILAVRAVVVQLGFFLHIQVSVLHQQSPVLTLPLVFATAFMCLFSVVIALFKDIPDVEGDRVYGILSLSVRVGQKRVYWLCVAILLLAYSAAVGVSLQSQILWSRVLSVTGHIVAAGLLWGRAQQVDFSSPASISQVYMFVWKLFYAEYLLLPLLRL